MKNSPFPRLTAVLLALSLLLPAGAPRSAATEGGGGDTPDPAPPAVSVSVSLSESMMELSQGGEAGTLTARLEVTPEIVPGLATVEWSCGSDRPGIASAEVTPGTDGSAAITVTPVLPGTTQVTVTAVVKMDGVEAARDSATCTVAVNYAAVTGITLSHSAVTLEPSDSLQLTATLTPASADDTDVAWETSKPSVASLSPNTGSRVLVSALSPGETSITATSGGKSGFCTVTVSGLTLDQTSLTLTSGKTGKLNATPYGRVSYVNQWNSSDESVATVSGDGTVTARNGGTAVITASYNGEYPAACTVTVRENTAGAITESLSVGQPLSFSGLAGEMDGRCRELLDSSLSYVTGLSVEDTDQGILLYGYVSVDDTGAGVSSQEKYYYSSGSGRLSLSNITFVAKPDFNGTAVISYTGYNASNQFFIGTIRLTVEETEDVVYSTGVNTPLTFSASDFSNACRNQNGRDAKYVTFTLPSTSKGTLYYNYVGAGQLSSLVEEDTPYYMNNNPYLDKVTFVPAEDQTGPVRISYSGKDTAGYTFRGRVTVYVSGSPGGSGDINYETDSGDEVEFKTNDFNSLCRDITGRNMDYVRFTLPPSSQGTLYYNYTGSGSSGSKVSASTRYYRSGSPYLSKVSFVPKSSYDGTVEIGFTGYDVNGEKFSGTVEIRVGEGDGEDGIVRYRTDRNEEITFSASDFNRACQDVLGENLNYVRFSLPLASRGTLYYDYASSGNYGSKVSASTSYYRSRSPELSRVTFVPKSGYDGTVEIDFTGYDVDGEKFSGTVEIRVGESDKEGVVSYRTAKNEKLTFSASDFNRACQDVLGDSLSYVRFTLPLSSQGTLYYNYTGSGSSGSKVSASTSYYRSRSPELSRVTFVPKSGYNGTVEIDFKGYDADGDRFSGTVEIRVGSGNSSSSGTQLHYSILSGGALTFDPADFNSVSKDETGAALSYVRFTPPSGGKGALYYNYREDTGKYDSKAVSSTSYYRTGGSKQLSKLSFVPADGFEGTLELDYTGWSTEGEKFTGTVTVTVAAPVAGTVRYTTGSGAVALLTEDFNSACYRLLDQNLSWVRFTPPPSSMGRLYYEYSGPGKYTSEVRSSVNYYRSGTPELGRVSFVPKAGFQGTASIAYAGQDTAGNSFSGTLEVQVSAPGASAIFRDMGSYSWAAPSVDFLYQNGVVSGVSATQYGPERSITRGDFVLMLSKAFELDTGNTLSFSDVPRDSYYARAVAAAKDLGITQGSGENRFYPERPVTRQDAMVLLQKAMQSAGWSIASGSASALAGYADRNDVAGYAQGAVAAMAELGVIRGDDAGRLNPGRNLTRAEMAVVLHQALTQ